MKIQIHQNISNLLDSNRNLIQSNISESYIIFPEEGKVIENIKTGQLYKGFVSVGTKNKLSNFREIDLKDSKERKN